MSWSKTGPSFFHRMGMLLPLALLGFSMCGCKCEESPPGQVYSLPLHVELSGCEEFWHPNRCFVSRENTLVFWIKSDKDATVRIAGARPVEVLELDPIHGGRRYSVAVSPTESSLRITAELGRKSAARLFRINRIHRSELLNKAMELKENGRHKEAAAYLTENLEKLEAEEKNRALSLLARLALYQDQVEISVERFERALQSHLKSGCISAAINDANALSYILVTRNRDFVGAREVLSRFDGQSIDASPFSFYLVYSHGNLNIQTANYRRALAEIAKAAQIAERFDQPKLRLFAVPMLAVIYQELGRSQEAVALLDDLGNSLPESVNPCDRVPFLINHGWSKILAREAGHKVAGSPIPLLRSAVESCQKQCRTLPDALVTAQLNLALAHLDEENSEDAEKILGDVVSQNPKLSGASLLESIQIKGRIHQSKGQYRAALHTFAEFGDRARLAMAPHYEWRARALKARVLVQMNQLGAALNEYIEADSLLDQSMLRVPVGEGRGTFLAQNKRITDEHVSLLLTLGKWGEALDVVRRARRRFIESIFYAVHVANLPEGRERERDRILSEYQAAKARILRESAEDWRILPNEIGLVLQQRKQQQKDLDNLFDRLLGMAGPSGNTVLEADVRPRSPARDETLLAYYPLEDQWIGFGASGEDVVVHRIGSLPEQTGINELSEKLLQPFALLVERNSKVRILAYGNLHSIDFHSLPWKSGVMLDEKEVVYSLDLAPRAVTSSVEDGSEKSRKILLVTDPQRDLRHSRREAKKIIQSIQSNDNPWQITHLDGRDATIEGFSRALPQADILHFSGHGAFSGVGGWESALYLSGQRPFTVGDILLMANKTPHQVVLFGCETGRAADDEPLSMGLAQAFILAGSKQVFASVRPLDDRLALELASRLYRKSPDALSLRPILLGIKKETLAVDWASMREYVP